MIKNKIAQYTLIFLWCLFFIILVRLCLMENMNV